MKTPRPLARARGIAAGFTLIEMVGVLAIMAIMAAVIAPSAFRSLDETAVRSEAQSLSNMGSQVTLYVRQNGFAPTPLNWTTTLATYAGLSPTDIATNSRQNNRVYLADPASNPPQRVLILSSMRPGYALPTPANIATAAEFAQIWNTPDGSVPPQASWAGWAAWGALANSGNYLVIERVSLAPAYAPATYTFTLNNRSNILPAIPSTASYSLVLADGTVQSANIPPGANATFVNQIPVITRISLYRSSGEVNLNYIYAVGTTGKTIDFDGTNWIPQ
jgi:prepilin-type N-terminal cleavage/methylation domain-containing protein